jgi:biopolymer transport protein ExbD
MAKKRKIPGINGSSMADLAFVILMFFLLTSSMDTHRGLQRRLPPPVLDPENIDIDINKRNLFVVRINSMNQLMVQGELLDIRQLREKTKQFIVNEFNESHLPEVTEEYIEPFGVLSVTKDHVISLQTDVDTQYQAYMEVQNELIAAYNELRDEFSRARLGGRTFSELPTDLQRAVQNVFPQNISEAEPRNFGGGN